MDFYDFLNYFIRLHEFQGSGARDAVATFVAEVQPLSRLGPSCSIG